MSVVDAVKRSEDERQAMQVAEDAREDSWKHKSFCEELFSGKFNSSDAVHLAKSEILDDDPNVEIASAFSLYLLGDSDNAEVRLRNLYTKRPNCTRTALAIAKILHSKGKFFEAAEIIDNISNK